MSAKEIVVSCPCCSARLVVDVLTAKVMRTERAESTEGVDKWSAAQQKVQGRTRSGAEKLENALEDERTKGSRFDELFKKAQDKHKRKDDA